METSFKGTKLATLTLVFFAADGFRMSINEFFLDWGELQVRACLQAMTSESIERPQA